MRREEARKQNGSNGSNRERGGHSRRHGSRRAGGHSGWREAVGQGGTERRRGAPRLREEIGGGVHGRDRAERGASARARCAAARRRRRGGGLGRGGRRLRDSGNAQDIHAVLGEGPCCGGTERVTEAEGGTDEARRTSSGRRARGRGGLAVRRTQGEGTRESHRQGRARARRAHPSCRSRWCRGGPRG